MNNISIGFSTVVTENWLELAKVLVDSILVFSQFPITVNCINFDYNFNNHRVISKSLILDSPNWNNICMSKWTTLQSLPYDITLMVDADMIALPTIDNIFQENYDKIQRTEFPLFAKHPHDPFSHPDHAQHLSFLIKLFTNNKPKIKYVYAHGLFHRKHQFFIDDMINHINPYFKTSRSFCGDEGLLNVLLTKYGVSEDIGYNYLPNYTLAGSFINDVVLGDKELYETYTKYDCLVKFYMFHGCKDNNIAQLILDKLKFKNLI